MSAEKHKWRFCCPVCRIDLAATEEKCFCCDRCGRHFEQERGIWRFLPRDRQADFAPFLRQYAIVRAAERRERDDPAYYRALPFVPAEDPLAAMWARRARSWQLLLREVIAPGEEILRIVDMGAGNGWLAHRLACRGHRVAAVDIRDGRGDGLGACAYYDVPLTLLQAEFASLPLAGGQADLVIFNAALHYSVNYVNCLRETKRVLRPRGAVVVMDTPVYHQRASGEQMVREREAHFTAQYGFPSNELSAHHFITFAEIARLGDELGLHWRFYWPASWWRRWLRRRRAAVLSPRRETAQFPLLLGRFS